MTPAFPSSAAELYLMPLLSSVQSAATPQFRLANRSTSLWPVLCESVGTNTQRHWKLGVLCSWSVCSSLRKFRHSLIHLFSSVLHSLSDPPPPSATNFSILVTGTNCNELGGRGRRWLYSDATSAGLSGSHKEQQTHSGDGIWWFND